MGKITDKNIAFINRLFINGFNRKEAYTAIYDCKDRYTSVLAYSVLQRPECDAYYKSLWKKFELEFDVNKKMIVSKLVHKINMYDEMLYIVTKDDPTEQELDKLERMKDIIKGADVLKAQDMVCKLIGAYEPEKIEISEKVYKIGFDFDDAEEV
tara:strand:- start:1882 stop:2343 length:462 start_codon:yes stop_codon:yes gene_type:complete